MKFIKPTLQILTGQTHEHVGETPESGGKKIHLEMRAAWSALSAEAAARGFEPRIVSGFRDFSSQLAIWNAKARGERPVLDSAARPIDFAALQAVEQVWVILRWSALPGASRHHWGSDIDVIDARALTPDMRVALVPAEFEAGGPFAPLHRWLDLHMHRFGFYRPYAEDLGGVAPERWHLSYAPISQPYLKAFTPSLLARAVASAEIELKDTVLSHLDQIYKRFVLAVKPFPAGV